MQLQSNHAIRTPHYYVRQFALSLGKENAHFFSTFNPLDKDTSLMRRLSVDPLRVRITRGLIVLAV